VEFDDGFGVFGEPVAFSCHGVCLKRAAISRALTKVFKFDIDETDPKPKRRKYAKSSFAIGAVVCGIFHVLFSGVQQIRYLSDDRNLEDAGGMPGVWVFGCSAGGQIVLGFGEQVGDVGE